MALSKLLKDRVARDRERSEQEIVERWNQYPLGGIGKDEAKGASNVAENVAEAIQAPSIARSSTGGTSEVDVRSWQADFYLRAKANYAAQHSVFMSDVTDEALEEKGIPYWSQLKLDQSPQGPLWRATKRNIGYLDKDTQNMLRYAPEEFRKKLTLAFDEHKSTDWLFEGKEKEVFSTKSAGLKGNKLTQERIAIELGGGALADERAHAHCMRQWDNDPEGGSLWEFDSCIGYTYQFNIKNNAEQSGEKDRAVSKLGKKEMLPEWKEACLLYKARLNFAKFKSLALASVTKEMIESDEGGLKVDGWAAVAEPTLPSEKFAEEQKKKNSAKKKLDALREQRSRRGGPKD